MAKNGYVFLERKVKEAALLIQEEIRELDSVHRFSFNIEVEGRTDGDIKIGYRIGTDYDGSVEAGTLAASLDEAKRRKGWKETHAPVLISHVTGEKVETVD